MVKHKTFEEWEKHYDYLIKELGYSNAIPRILGRKKILFNNLKLKKLILELGFNGIIPSDYGKKLELYENIQLKLNILELGFNGIIPSDYGKKVELYWNLKKEKPVVDETDYECYTAEGIRITSRDLTDSILSDYKNQKKSTSYFDKKYLKTILKNHNYVIDFETQADIFAHHKIMKKHIFLNLTSGPKHKMEIMIYQLSRFLSDLKRSFNSQEHSKQNEFIEKEGALTNFDWHAFNPSNSRQFALIRKCAIDGIISTIATLNHLTFNNRWGSPNSQNHLYLDKVLDDIDWLKKTFPIFDNTSKKFLISRIETLKNEFSEIKDYGTINLMLIVNINN